MFDSKSRKQCGNEEALISFVYDEMKPRERREFEAHLATCEACSVEAASFEAISESISAWKLDFERLPTPPISIETESEKASVPRFFESIFVWVNQGFGKAFVGFAALAIAALLGWAIISKTGEKAEVASAEISKAQPNADSSETAIDKPTTVATESLNDSANETGEDLPKPISNLDAASFKTNRVSPPSNQTSRRSVKTQSRSFAKVKHEPAPKAESTKKTSEAEVTPMQRLTGEFAIDSRDSDNLNLNDLLDEVAVVND